MPSFDPLVEAYDAARPGYPPEVYDALEPLSDLVIVEGGAGTGLATRALRARGAHVTAIDIGQEMLRRNSGDRVVADAATLPVRDRSVDVVCFAQAWHWLDHAKANIEVARVLRRPGRLAAWWSFSRDDQRPWMGRYWEVVEAMTTARRWHRDTDWGMTFDTDLFDDPVRTAIPWVREVSIDTWLLFERSTSSVGMHDNPDAVIVAIEGVLRDEFGDGPVRVAYETLLWQARTRVSCSG